MSMRFVVLVVLLPLAACTTLRPLTDSQPATIRQAVEPGDRVELELVDGSRQALTVDGVTDDALTGTHGGKRHSVPLASIRSIGVREMTTQDKVLTGVGVAAVIGAIAAVAGGGGNSGGGNSGGGY